MNINPLAPGGDPRARSVGTDSQAQPVAPSAAPSSASGSESDRAGDRFEFSAEARARQAADAARKAEVDGARARLHDLDTLDPERLAALRERVAEGGYTGPEAHQAIAEGIVRDLRGDAPA